VRNKTLALLRKLDEISLSNSKIEDIARKVAVAISTELGYDLVSVAIVNPEHNCLQWIGLASPLPWIQKVLEDTAVDKMCLPLDEHIDSLLVIKSEKPSFADDLHKVFPPGFVASLAAANADAKEPVQHSMMYPLRYSDQTVGLLSLSAARSFQELSSFEQESVTGIVGLIALALYKAKIYEDLQKTTVALANANKQLQELDKAKSEFLSIASHQLYTPLTALRGYISMLLEGDFGTIDEKQRPILDILNTSALRLIDLIKSLLDISRIERGKLELNLVSADLAQMAMELVRDLVPNASAKGLLLEFHQPPATLPHVVVDQQRIRQVLLNFVDNAIKYTPEGRVDVFVEQEAKEIVFKVQDTGKGITDEEINLLFNKFTRVGGASRFHTEGTGLGLYVAKQIVKEHHGDVGVTSPGDGKGSTFLVRLPIEGSSNSLKAGQKASVEIKSAETRTAEEGSTLPNLTLASPGADPTATSPPPPGEPPPAPMSPAPDTKA
ncbi:MAG: GAF domain-containing sensor histidine kinase, partial [Candidatus Andersenbacteria bacterium]|nr:GAF domain-containing sensor histidine kinase [Candidatus Andersenbacteria bacterium]